MNNLESYLEQEHYNINYKEDIVTNFWGKEYLVTFTDSRFCGDKTYTNPFTDVIDLTPPCKKLKSKTETDNEFYTSALSHQLGHTDTNIITLPIIAYIGGKKILKKIGKKDFLNTTLNVTITSIIFAEITARIASRVLHGQELGYITDLYHNITNLF